MRLLALLAAGLFASALVAAPVPKEKPKVKDEDAILGTWQLDKLDGGDGGAALRPEELARVTMTFKKGGKLFRTGNSGPGEDRDTDYTLDPAAKPKTLDYKKAGDKEPVVGIYELDGDTLRWCSSGGTTRPTEIKADGMGMVVLTFKRVKDEKKEEKKDK